MRAQPPSEYWREVVHDTTFLYRTIEREENPPRSKRRWGAFKFALAPQNAQILGVFDFSWKLPFFLAFAQLVIRFLFEIFPFGHPRAKCYDFEDSAHLKRTALRIVSARLNVG